MAANQFAPWVEPIAAGYRESRAESVRLAQSLDEHALVQPTGDSGWTVRDELVHIAASGTDFARLLDPIVRGETPDTSVFADIDARNSRNLESRRGWSIAEIGTDLEGNGSLVQELLQKLHADDEARQPQGFPFSLKDLLGGYGQHDAYHLDQIRQATGSTRGQAT